MTGGFYMKCNIGPKRVNRLMKNRKSKQTLMIQSLIYAYEFKKHISLVVWLSSQVAFLIFLFFVSTIWVQNTVEKSFFF